MTAGRTSEQWIYSQGEAIRFEILELMADRRWRTVREIAEHPRLSHFGLNSHSVGGHMEHLSGVAKENRKGFTCYRLEGRGRVRG